MPKMKTHSGAKKRFRLTGKGKVRARHAMLSHKLGHKSAKRKRRLERPKQLAKGDERRAKEVVGQLAGASAPPPHARSAAPPSRGPKAVPPGSTRTTNRATKHR